MRFENAHTGVSGTGTRSRHGYAVRGHECLNRTKRLNRHMGSSDPGYKFIVKTASEWVQIAAPK